MQSCIAINAGRLYCASVGAIHTRENTNFRPPTTSDNDEAAVTFLQSYKAVHNAHAISKRRHTTARMLVSSSAQAAFCTPMRSGSSSSPSSASNDSGNSLPAIDPPCPCRPPKTQSELVSSFYFTEIGLACIRSDVITSDAGMQLCAAAETGNPFTDSRGLVAVTCRSWLAIELIHKNGHMKAIDPGPHLSNPNGDRRLRWVVVHATGGVSDHKCAKQEAQLPADSCNVKGEGPSITDECSSADSAPSARPKELHSAEVDIIAHLCGSSSAP